MRRSLGDTPVSTVYGFDRGTPVDRLYLDRFLHRHRAEIRGRILEVGERNYARRFGRAVEYIEVVDIDPQNRRANVLADVSVEGSLPLAEYDCFLFIQTLQLVSDMRTALRNAWDCLRPGGAMFVTISGLMRRDPTFREIDRWRLTPLGLDRMLRELPAIDYVDTQGFGNRVAALAGLAGFAEEEVAKAELEPVDARFVVLTCAVAKKNGDA